MLAKMPTRQAGVTLTGLMVGSAVGLLVLSGVLAVYVITAKGAADNIAQARLNQELRALMEIMQEDVRRAGYAATQPDTDNDGDGDKDSDDLIYNPFTSGINDLATGAYTGAAANSCITYTYNADDDSPPRIGACSTCTPTAAPFDAVPYDTGNVEMFGFRLRDGAVEMRTGVSSASESTFDCNSGSWEDVTSSTVTVTHLLFSLSTTSINLNEAKAHGDACTTGDPCQYVRQVSIELGGEATSDPEMEQTIRETVSIRNDRYEITP